MYTEGFFSTSQSFNILHSSKWWESLLWAAKDSSSLEGQLDLLKKEELKLSEEEKTTLLIEALSSKKYSKLTDDLKIIFSSLSDKEGALLVEQACLHILETDAAEISERLIDLLSVEKLKSFAEYIQKDLIDIKQLIEELYKLIPYYEKIQQGSIKNNLKQEIKKQKPIIFNFFINLINTIMSTFNLLDMGKTTGTYYETKYKLDIYWKFLTVPILIFQALSLYFLNPLKTCLVFGIASLVSSIAIYGYFKWIQPCPDTLPFCQNLTTEAKKGTLDPVLGRDAEINELISTLSSNMNGARKHPLLIGKSGVGKTEIVNGLAQRIITGDVPDSIKGKKVFSLNTSDLIPADGGFQLRTPIAQLVEAVGNHKDDILLFLDEIQAAVSTQTSSMKVGVELRKALDHAPGNLPLCIGATTEEEYQKFIFKDLPFARRFKVISVNEMNKDQTLAILNGMALREAPDLLIDEECLSEIYKLSQKESQGGLQPAKSKDLLAHLIAQVRNHLSSGELQDRLRQKNEKKQKIISELTQTLLSTSSIDFKLFHKKSEKLSKIEKSLVTIQQEIDSQFEIYAKFQRLKKERANQETKIFELTKKISESCEKNPTELKKMHQLFLLTFYGLLPALDKKIKEIVEVNNLKVKITMSNFIK